MTNDELRRVSERVGRNIRERRRSQGLTLEQLALQMEELGQPMNFGTVAKAERGQRNISVDEVQAFAKALGMSVDGLMSSPDEVMAVHAVDEWLAAATHLQDLQALVKEAERRTGLAVSNVAAHAEIAEIDLADLLDRRLGPVHAQWLLSEIDKLNEADQ